MIKVAAFTQGVMVPSARFRVRQYIPALFSEGIKLDEMISRLGAYPPGAAWLRPWWAVATLAAQLPNVIKSYHYDVVLLQREIMSTIVTLEPLVNQPRVLDVDDAIYLHRDGRFARHLAELSETVICGNVYLAEWFAKWNHNIAVIPTAVDVEYFTPSSKTIQQREEVVIGWVGTFSNLKYLLNIETALAKVMRKYLHVRLLVISDYSPKFRSLPVERVEFLRWTEEGDAERIQGMDIGIMPLEDSLWARGKCSFKMLQYMACGLPVIVSPVGMNKDVLGMGCVGIAATTEFEWVDALSMLVEDGNLRSQMGANGRKIVENAFSLKVLAPRIAACILDL